MLACAESCWEERFLKFQLGRDALSELLVEREAAVSEQAAYDVVLQDPLSAADRAARVQGSQDWTEARSLG